MRRKQRKTEEHEDTHRWVVSYADFITLLFAFFVVMYALSSINISKYRAFSTGVTSAFQSQGKQKKPNKVEKDTEGHSQTTAKGDSRENFHTLNDNLVPIQDDSYQVKEGHGWVQLDIKAGALFESGSADLKPSALIQIMKIAQIVKNHTYPVFIEGYTDDLPIHTPQFPSNWELSTARAASIARALASYGVLESRMTVTGYGAQFPIADNKTKAGRLKNRRVNLIFAKDRMVPRVLNPNHEEPEKSEIAPIPKEKP